MTAKPAVEFSLRPATADDCEAIMAMNHELAVYEKMPDAVHIDVETLRRDGFGERPYFQCLVAETHDPDRTIVGYALFFPIYSTWDGRSCHMEDLYVKPEWRRRGIGSSLMRAVTQRALEDGCRRLQWAVLRWNEPAILYYKSTGAFNVSEQQQWDTYRLDHAEMVTFASSTGSDR